MNNKVLIKTTCALLQAQELTVATAESCTAGGLGWALTTLAGSSAWYLGGLNSYSNAIKQEILKVPQELLIEHGAVSLQVAQAMAQNIRELLSADIGLSITGIAGPSGGTLEKPVGMVCFGLAMASEVETQVQIFDGNRDQVRAQAVDYMLEMLKKRLALNL